MDQTQDEQRALVIHRDNPLALMQAIDVAEIAGTDLIVPSLRADGSHPWIYQFPQEGKTVVGISVDGIEDACRALATKGEIIQEMECRLEFHDEREAFFLAKAGRFTISPEGTHIGPLDTAIRALRQPKYMKLRSGGEKLNEKWYEVGVSKANRNAKEALIPEKMKQQIIAIAMATTGRPPAGPALKPPRSEPTTADEIEGEYQDVSGDVTYSHMLGNRGQYAAALNELQRGLKDVGLRTVPPNMMDLTPAEILRRVSGAA